MKKLKMPTVVAIVLAAAAMLYLAKTTDAQGDQVTTITVNIYVKDGAISVDQDSVDLYKNQQVAWASPDGDTFSVEFQGPGPFSAPDFSNAQNANKKAKVPSGKATGKAGTYKYTVKVGNLTLDPQIIIH